MPTDDDRREVTRRLRELRPGACFDDVYEALGAYGPSPYESRGLSATEFARLLADLIEPSCDRDALLALAEDVDGAADESGGFEPLAGMLRDIARRIREALGGGRMSRRALAFSLACLLAWAVAMALALAGCSSDAAEATAWPESAEFSTLETGQDRFSLRDTNLGGWSVLVDHETGVQYVVGNTVHTVCPLLDADGSPLLVAEAGE